MLEETPSYCILGSWHQPDSSQDLYMLSVSLCCTELGLILHLVGYVFKNDCEVLPNNT